MRHCSIEGCTRESIAKSLCKKHYQQYARRTRKTIFDTPEYTAWISMKARCYNPNYYLYDNYAGRGIKVCDEWVNDFKAFYAYIGDRPSDKHSLDRINNDGNYEPGNVRWATYIEQARNRRPRRGKSGDVNGVTYLDDAGKWKVSIGLSGNKVHVGYFKTHSEAVSARRKAEEVYWNT